MDYWVSPELPTPPIPDMSEVVVVLPPHVQVQGDNTTMEKLLSEGFFSQLEHATQAVGGAKLKPKLEEIGLDRITARFSAAMVHAAYDENSEILTPEYTDVTAALNPLFRLLETEYAGQPVRWVAILTLEEQPSAKDLQAFFEVTAGLYDLQRNALSSVVRFHRYAGANQLGITARMAGIDAATRLTHDETGTSLETEPPPPPPGAPGTARLNPGHVPVRAAAPPRSPGRR